MRKQLIAAILVMVLCAPADAQTREVTDSGTFLADASGRYVRLEGPDGIIVNYLYDGPEPVPAGIAVKPKAGVTLTVRYDDRGGVTVAGLPAITAFKDHEGRTTAVQADRRPVALLDYTPAGLVAAVTLPSRLTWKVSTPNSSGLFWQSVENATGKVVASSVITDVAGHLRTAWYDAAAADLGVSMNALTYEQSPTGALTTARDAKGRVAFYLVHAEGCDVGFSPDGTPRFYDLTLSLFGGTIAPGSDVMVSPAQEVQGSAVPDHLVLTARGAAGLYVENAPAKAIAAAWTDRYGKVSTVVAGVEAVTNANR